MNNRKEKRLDFRKIALISIPLSIVMFLLRNLLQFFYFNNIFSYDLSFSNFLYFFLYNYVYVFIIFSVFIYLRKSFPSDIKKAGLFYGLILFLVGKAPSSFFAIVVSFNSDYFSEYSDFALNKPITNLVTTSIPGLITLFVIAFIISFVYNKYYLKAK